jgi:hypothetical protein
MAKEDEAEIAALKARLAALEQNAAGTPAAEPKAGAGGHPSSDRAPQPGAPKKGKLPAWMLICGAVVGVLVLVEVAGHLGGFDGIDAPSNTTSGSATPADAATTPQADFERVNAAFKSAVAPCEVGFLAATKALRSGDRYGGYDVAQRGKQACVSAWVNADATKFSEATPEPARDKLNADLKDCSGAFALNGAALDSISRVLNGDDKPSTVSTATQDIAHASDAVTSCMATYAADLKAAGVKVPSESASGPRRHHQPAAAGT